MRALAILGPNAHEHDLAPFRAAGAEITVAENAASRSAEAVLIVGGDGTVQRQLTYLVQAQVSLLAVPAGSANDFARALGIRTRTDALRAWKTFLRGGEAKPIDVGLLNFAGEGARHTNSTYFCCAAGAGLDAAVAARANSLSGWVRGHGGYFLAAIPELLRFPGQRIQVTASAGQQIRTVSEAGLVVAAANAPWYGHGMRIAPRAQFDDGQLEVCFVRDMPRLRLLRLFPSIYRGAHIGLPEVEYFRAEHLRIETSVPLPVHADGDVVGHTPVEVSVLPRALRVINQFSVPGSQFSDGSH